MKSLIIALSLATAFAGLAPTFAEAKRIGGGSSSGMQRSMPAKPPAPATPAQPAQASPTAPANAGAPAVAPKRNWMGPIAGLAAGLGIAALMSHLGMGEGMGNMIMMVLLAVAAFALIRFLMRRFAGGGMQPAMATPNGARFEAQPPTDARNAGVATGSNWTAPAAAAAPVAAAAAATLPADFDAPAFERLAKMIFIRMQAANDTADLVDLRSFTTPEMFATIKLDLQDRGNAAQTTDVVRVDAQVLDVATEAQQQIVSVRFHGLIREEADKPTTTFDEIWHVTRPVDGSREWAIAGIQQAEQV